MTPKTALAAGLSRAPLRLADTSLRLITPCRLGTSGSPSPSTRSTRLTSRHRTHANWSALSAVRHFATATNGTMSSADVELKAIISPELLASVRDYWFAHIPDEDTAVLPQMELMKPWFFGGEEFDRGCVKRFAKALQSIHSLNPTTASLLALLDGASPEDWLAAVLLLDQTSRNCYRGPNARLVFTFFDPLARALAQRAIELGIPTTPPLKYYACRRMWFYLPLMHSEELALHDKAVAEYEQMGVDFRTLLADPSQGATERDRRCGEILSENKDDAEKLLNMNYEFEMKHRDIIAKFGRYPHRNAPLGRDMTPEEQEYLDNGGDTFAAKG